MLVAAEPSGDALGAALAEALKATSDVRLIGVGGPLMERHGIVSPFDIAPLSVLGIFDALAAYPLVRRRAREVGELAARERPDAAVLIDSWGFNLRVAHAVRRRFPGARLIKYVGPQVWATRPGRGRTLAKAVDQLLTPGSSVPDWPQHSSAIQFSRRPGWSARRIAFEHASVPRRTIPCSWSRREAVVARLNVSWVPSRKPCAVSRRIARH
jgi:hypothetical protein